MCKVTLKSSSKRVFTQIPNRFILEYMADSKGEYLKLYLLLLHLMSTDGDFSIPTIAEQLDWVEPDVNRALKYWAKKGILEFELNTEGELVHIHMTDLLAANPTEGRASSDSASAKVASARVSEDVSSDAKTKKPASARREPMNPNKAMYLRCEEILGTTASKELCDLVDFVKAEPCFFSDELVVFLFEYCTGIGKSSLKYIHEVAMGWYNNNIHTVSEAQKHIINYTGAVRAVKEAFGLYDRNLGESEAKNVERWSKEWEMSPELIKLACTKTIDSKAKVDFRYANSILKKWFEGGAKTLADVEKLEQNFKDSRETLEKEKKTDKIGKGKATSKSGDFGDFHQREYSSEEWAQIMTRLQKWD